MEAHLGDPGGRVDVHAHFLPAFYREALAAAGVERPDGMPGVPAWSPAAALAAMDRLGVRTAMLSISSPGVHFGDDAAAVALARRVNAAGAALRRAHPGRFGVFAALPLPDVAAAVAEAITALDDEGADGVVLETHADGLYLGDPRLDALYAVLDARDAVVFVHPTSPGCSCSARLDGLYPRPMLEFMFETTRSVADMVLAGVLDRFARLRVIVPHAGAALPVLAGRIEAVMRSVSGAGPAPAAMAAAMRRLYFDLAGAPVPHLLTALLAQADPGRLFYGSDWPFTPLPGCEAMLRALETTELLDEGLRREVFAGNAMRVFPRLGGG